MKSIYLIITISVFLLNTCGQQTIPTIDPTQVQASAVSIASTTISLTTTPIPTEISNSSSLSNLDCCSNTGNDTNTSWFSGGTLHNSTIREWRQASYSNRLATAADFIAATQNVDYGDMNGFKRMATDLETCISTSTEGGAADSEQTTFVSALCMTQLFPK